MDDKDIVKLYFERNETAISETHKKYGRYCYYIAVDFSELIAEEGMTVVCDFVIPDIVGLDVFYFEEREPIVKENRRGHPRRSSHIQNSSRCQSLAAIFRAIWIISISVPSMGSNFTP